VSDPSETVDEKVLRLRGEGQAYARISRDLGLDRVADAQQAFRRALRRLPPSDAERVRREEASRLDRLAERVRADTGRDDMDRARQLKTIERMRSQISDDS
jgi:aminoglycoside phosphotransferase